MIEKKPERICVQVGKLMRDVYYLFSACIWLDESGKTVDIYLFDTQHCRVQCCIPNGAKQCLLISNHPSGCMRPMDEDMRNWQKLKELSPDLIIRLLIYSEDEGLYEMAAL